MIVGQFNFLTSFLYFPGSINGSHCASANLTLRSIEVSTRLVLACQIFLYFPGSTNEIYLHCEIYTFSSE